MKTDHIEILAPAGSFETLKTAIHAGCDAIYFGIADFNMRATAAANFTRDDLPKVTEIAKDNNIKTYLTINTVLYDEEINKMHEIVDLAKKHNVTAIIAADMATIMYCQEVGVETHISTQLSISNVEGVKFYSKFADRMVLARELTLEQVKHIAEEIKNQDIRGPKGNLVELEIFAHGALCVAVSGRCGMSLYSHGKSANRGQCSQMCRRQYKVTDVSSGKELQIDNNYVMSASDLCTIGMLPEIIDAGVVCLKFEGRGRSPEYVDTVISTYREALDYISKDEYPQEKIDDWNKKLGTVFNRGMSEGLYRGVKFSKWAGAHGSRATKERTWLGEIVRYYPKLKVVEIKIKADEELLENEDFSITGDKTGIIRGNIGKFRVNGKPSKTAKQNDLVTFQVDKKPRTGDKFYVIRDRKSLIPKGRDSIIKT